MRAVAQLLGLIEVTIREWVRPMFDTQADYIAQTTVFLSIWLVLLTGLQAYASQAVRAVSEFRPRGFVYLGVAVVFACLGTLLFDSGRADRRAAEALNRWPRLATHAKLLSLAFCLLSLLLWIGHLVWIVKHRCVGD